MSSSDAIVHDLHWLGRPDAIAAWQVDDVLIDCGPTTSLPRLLEALGDWRPRAVLLTHIHFDHAGAAGALVERWPDLEVWVHRRGARHLISPERLEASARRVFGEDFDRRFGGLVPIPEGNVHVLDGGEALAGFRVAYTPGHASHHVSFLHEESGRAYVGDVAACRLRRGTPVTLPAPPPDIDLVRWRESLELVAGWQPTSLGITHFGAIDDVEEHLEAVRRALTHHEQVASTHDEAGYVAEIRGEQAADADAQTVDDLEIVVGLRQNYVGLRRWLDQREAGA